jgi:hypothetical protein
MGWERLDDWFNAAPLWVIAIILFGSMCVAAYVGMRLRRYGDRSKSPIENASEAHEGYIVSATLGLLALLMGFTFSLAVERFETRRALVREEANAIGTAYLRAQLLVQPHRDRTEAVLLRYLDNRIALAKADPGKKRQELLAINDALITDLWAATSEAFETIKGLDWSSAYLDSINHVTDLDLERKVARAARVPAEVFSVLAIYTVAAAGVLGYVLRGRVVYFAAGTLLALFTMALVLTIDIDRPTGGGVDESQRAMELLQETLLKQSPAVYDKWRTPPGGAKVSP